MRHLQSNLLAARFVGCSPGCSVLLQKCAHGLTQRKCLYKTVKHAPHDMLEEANLQYAGPVSDVPQAFCPLSGKMLAGLLCNKICTPEMRRSLILCFGPQAVKSQHPTAGMLLDV